MKLFVLPFLLILAACGRDESLYSYGGAGGVWQVQTINGASFNSRAHIAFEAQGVVTGTGPCNAFRARNTVPYPWVSVGPIAATKRACPDLAQEAEFFSVLERVTLGIIRDEVLTLSNDGGDELRLIRTPATDG